MFDYLRCKYPLPHPEFQGIDFQTKSTPIPASDLYEIRDDGTLWRENFTPVFIADPGSVMGGRIHKKDVRWEPFLFDGSVRFYAMVSEVGYAPGWIEYEASFSAGRLVKIAVVEYRKPSDD